MPSFLITIFTGVVSAFGRELFNVLYSGFQNCYQSVSPVEKAIENNRKTAKLFNIEDFPLISNSTVEKCLLNLFNDRYGGVWVLGAPSGSGKSVYTNAAIAAIRTKPNFDADIVILSDSKFLNYNEILKELRATNYNSLSNALPRYTIFVIDQIDISSISNDQLDTVVRLATEGRNQRTFAVLLIVSNASVMCSILKANGGEKIEDVCDPKLLIIDSKNESTRMYLRNRLHDYYQKNNVSTTSSEKNILEATLFTICSGYFSPAIVLDLLRETKNGQLSPDELQVLTITFAQQQELKWKEFENTFKNRKFRYEVRNKEECCV